LRHLVRIADNVHAVRDAAPNTASSKGVAKKGLRSVAENGQTRLRELEPAGRHSSEAGHQSFQSLYFFQPNLDVFRIDSVSPRPAAEKIPEEIDGVSDLVRQLGCHGFDERRALFAPCRRLLPTSIEFPIARACARASARLIRDRLSRSRSSSVNSAPPPGTDAKASETDATELDGSDSDSPSGVTSPM
jgi:hypothetical protein